MLGFNYVDARARSVVAYREGQKGLARKINRVERDVVSIHHRSLQRPYCGDERAVDEYPCQVIVAVQSRGLIEEEIICARRVPANCKEDRGNPAKFGQYYVRCSGTQSNHLFTAESNSFTIFSSHPSSSRPSKVLVRFVAYW